jgi:hypothetical protein
MSNVSLSEFAGKLRAKNRISFGDVQRLQRGVVPNGIASREDAEILVRLDRDVSRADSAWERWLVALFVDFVVWAERPAGVVDEDTASWLAATLKGDGERPTKTGRLIVREIVQEAQAFENKALTALGGAFSKAKSRPRAQTYEPTSLAA